MRAPKNSAKGSSGQSFVKGQFEELGWGAVLNPEHDLGTDLFIMARDSRRFDLGALVGAQVKNWKLEFDAPEHNEGEEGWWFSDSEEHFEYWLTHRVPHLLVFYSKDAKVCYWVHIEPGAVVSTGKLRKIFVPKAQTVDANHFDDLVAIATSVSSVVTWEGSAWSPGRDIPQESQLRYALIVPRLVAPHGNSSVEDVSAAQGIALVTAVRLGDISHRYKEAQPLLDSELSFKSDDAKWNLFAAFFEWTAKGLIGPLHDLAMDSEAPDLRAAHLATLTAALFERGEVREAIEILESTLDKHDDYNPVDYAWLNLHLARNLMQIGELRRAFDLALEVAPIGQIAVSDPTARLFAGIASDIVFSLSGWQAGDIESTIKARDTVASWWRSQTMTSGLAKQLENAFKSWADDKSVTFGASDETWARLRSATLISGHAADTSNWRYESALLAEHVLMLADSSDRAASALNLLRIAGHTKELTLAVDRMLERGPTDALDNALIQVDLERSTRDSMRSDLELLGLAGPLLSPEVADNTITWLLNELRDPMVRAQSLGLRFFYMEQLVTALARVYIASSVTTQATVRKHVAELPTIDDQLTAHNYASLLARIERQDWTDKQIAAMGARDVGDNFELRDALDDVIASRDPSFRSALEDRIKDGDSRALSSWGDVRDLSAGVAAGMMIRTAEAVRQQVVGARSGMHGFGGDSPLRTLVLLNIWYPDGADWAPVIEAVTEINSGPNDLAPGLDLMESHADRVPADVKEQLRTPLQRLSSTTTSSPFAGLSFGKSEVRGEAALLLVAFFPNELPEAQLLELLRGTPAQRAAAVRLIGDRHRVDDLPLFAVLATSDDAEVKAAVAAALSKWVALGLGGEAPLDLVRAIVSESGVRLAARVTSSVAQQERSKGAEELLELMENHRSAVVRGHVRVIRERWANLDKTV